MGSIKNKSNLIVNNYKLNNKEQTDTIKSDKPYNITSDFPLKDNIPNIRTPKDYIAQTYNNYKITNTEETDAIKANKPYNIANDISFKIDKPVFGTPQNHRVVFIHGTNSGQYRWNNYPNTISMYLHKALENDQDTIESNTYIPNYFHKNSQSYSFDWSTNKETDIYNGLFNDYRDRRKAKEKLINEILEWKKMSNFDEITLISHSHGGNVAIQAADELADIFKKVTIVTYATPAMNRKYITHNKIYPYLISPFSGYFINKLIDNYGTKKLNPESPTNFKNSDKITHLAYYSEHDPVDDYAYILECLRHETGMNSETSHYSDTTKTKNILIDESLNYEIQLGKIVKQHSKNDYTIGALFYILNKYLKEDDYDLKELLTEIKSYEGIVIENESQLIYKIENLKKKKYIEAHSFDTSNPEYF